MAHTHTISKDQLQKIANTIRGLSMDGVGAAHSGHPGLPLGMADVASVLWSKHINFNPQNPEWFNRDRFVLSGGHGSMLLYSILHLYGYYLSIEYIKQFRQWGSKTPGHPELHDTPGVETTTGPLGQGISNAVGMAFAEKSLSARFNGNSSIIDHYTYCMAGDGDLQEGISHEAASFAGHNKLGKLILLYDDNNITIDGETSLSFTEDVLKRHDAYGWHTMAIDGHDYEAINKAIEEAKSVTDKPSIIACKTIIGFGSPHRGGTSKAHGEPFPEDEIKLTKAALGLPIDKKFYVAPEIQELKDVYTSKGKEAEQNWDKKYDDYTKKYTELSQTLQDCIQGKIDPKAFDMPYFTSDKSMATRAASGAVLNYLAPIVPSFLGGSADLTPSNKTFPKSETAYSNNNQSGRYIHYGVREHGMTGIMNGMALHGGILPYAGTFFVFTDYMRPAMRMAALMGLQSIYVLTHDSIGLGEDGPTHQPIAHLASLRAMPNISVIRPMCANETAEAWKTALKQTTKPTCLVLTRQNLPTYDREKEGFAPVVEAQKGGYVLTEDKDFTSIVIASGSEVEIAVEAKKTLNVDGHKVRIVSMPSTDIFDAQSTEYKESVLPPNCTNRISIEAGATLSWYKYVGLRGKAIGIDRFGASAPYQTLYKELGITKEAIIEAVHSFEK